MTLDEITALAAREYFEYQGAYRNPYRQGTPEFDAYERGWMQSLKRDDARLLGGSGMRPRQKAGPKNERKK